MENNVKKIEITHKTIIFTVLFILSLRFLYEIRSIILAVFVSIILMAALNPVVDKIEKLKIPRWLSIILIYLVFLVIIAGPIAWMIPPLIDQTDRLVDSIIGLADRLAIFGLSPEWLQGQLQQLGGLPSQIIRLSVSIISNIVYVLGVLVITFYLILERANLDEFALYFFGPDKKERAIKVIDRLEKRLGRWVRTEFLLMTIIGFFSYLGFIIIGLNFALPLAIIAGILELLIYIGPIVTAVLALLIGLLQSPLMGLLAFGWIVIIQQLESNFLIPQLMRKTLGLNPLITLIGLSVGFKLGGIAGAILFLPIYLTAEVLIREFYPLKKKEQGE